MITGTAITGTAQAAGTTGTAQAVAVPAGMPADPDGSDAASGLDPQTADLAARLRLVVGRLHRRARLDGPDELPPLQLSTLATVALTGPLRASELAGREAVTPPTMSRVIAALDERGLVERRPDPSDARCNLLAISPEGHRQLERIRGRRTAFMARQLHGLSARERDLLTAALPALERMIADEVG
jgi:DNA-binding MarR family transcriptional regulator